MTSHAGWKPAKSAGGAKTDTTVNAQGKGSKSSSQAFPREKFAEIAGPLISVGLHASFIALPFTDTNDGQTVLCYRSYFPATMAAVY